MVFPISTAIEFPPPWVEPGHSYPIPGGICASAATAAIRVVSLRLRRIDRGKRLFKPTGSSLEFKASSDLKNLNPSLGLIYLSPPTAATAAAAGVCQRPIAKLHSRVSRPREPRRRQRGIPGHRPDGQRELSEVYCTCLVSRSMEKGRNF